MKTRTFIQVATASILFALTSCGVTEGSDSQGKNASLSSVNSGGQTDINQDNVIAQLESSKETSTLTEEESSSLLFIREEEKLARDVYQFLFEKWNQKIFSNISSSEQSHTDAVKTLINFYNLTDPVKDDAIGTFDNSDLASLYKELTSQGSTSLVEALKMGATIEELDIRDIQVDLEKIENANIISVYENLLKGSRNHLRSFMKQIANQGGIYTPVYISQEQFDDIVNSDMEKN